MPNLSGQSRAQTKFLRACAKDPLGLSHSDWPSAAIFRRWMRRPTFRKAVKGIRDALRFQADLELTAAASVAARALNQTIAHPDGDDAKLARQREQLKDLITLLKLVHARERFTAPRELAEPAPPRPHPRRTTNRIVLEYLQRDVWKPYQPISEVIDHIRVIERMEQRAAAERAAAARRAA